MKDFIINVIFFSIIILMFWSCFKFTKYQNRGLKDFEGLTHEQIIEGVEYTKKQSYNLD